MDAAAGTSLPGPQAASGPDAQTVSRGSFWHTVHRAFMDRDLNRSQVKAYISRGLEATRGSYRELVELLGLPATDYHRFMDFLRHQDLKPDRGADTEWRGSELSIHRHKTCCSSSQPVGGMGAFTRGDR